MNTVYSILWIDNEFDQVRPVADLIEGDLGDRGLGLDIREKASLNVEELRDLATELEKNCIHDLILIDYNLGEQSEDGAEVVRMLRHSVYTDIVFYSAANPDVLCRKLCEQSVGGVYTTSRDGLQDDVVALVDDHLKRWSRLDGYRGLLLSQLAEIEDILRLEIVRRLHDSSGEVVDRIFRRWKKNKKKTLEGQLERIDKLESAVDAFADYEMTSFNDVRTRLQLLLEKGDLSDLLENEGALHQVQKTRNDFAHKSVAIEDGEVRLKEVDTIYDIEQLDSERRRLCGLRARLDVLLDAGPEST